MKHYVPRPMAAQKRLHREEVEKKVLALLGNIGTKSAQEIADAGGGTRKEVDAALKRLQKKKMVGTEIRWRVRR